MNKLAAAVFFAASALASASFAAQYSRDALHRAASDGNVEKVIEILRSKPDPEIRDTSGGTALHSAVFQNNPVIVSALVNAGFDVNAVRPMDGNTPLHDAVRRGNLPAVKILMEHGADAGIKNLNRLTPADIADREGKKEISDYFAGLGVNPD